MKTKYLAWYAFSLLVVMMSCRKEVLKETIVEVPVETAWKENKNFRQYAKVRTNSLATNDVLLFDGPNEFNRLHPDGTLERRWKYFHPEYYELPLHENFYLELGEDLSTIATYNALGLQTTYDGFIDFKNLEPDFEEIYFNGSWSRINIAINDLGQCLVPIKKAGDNGTTTIYLLDTERTPHFIGHDVILFSDTIRITIPVSSFSNIVGFEDYFLLGSNDGVFKIDERGIYQKVLDQASVIKFIKHQDKIYAVKQSQEFFTSSDEGETWDSKVGFPTPLFSHQSFGDSLIAFRNDNIYTLRLGEDFYQLRPLNNEGLESTGITSISTFRDTVYVTTYSGVYQRSLADFYEDL